MSEKSSKRLSSNPAESADFGHVYRRIARESKKRKNVNIRIAERDLSQIRERASREGVPYQTPIASVLHKYVTDQLYDEREIRKTLDLIESSGKKYLLSATLVFFTHNPF